MYLQKIEGVFEGSLLEVFFFVFLGFVSLIFLRRPISKLDVKGNLSVLDIEVSG